MMHALWESLCVACGLLHGLCDSVRFSALLCLEAMNFESE